MQQLSGSVVKLILNLILIPIPTIGIYGAVIASVVGQGVMAIIMFRIAKSSLDLKLGIVKYAIKPILATLIMGIVVGMSYNAINRVVASNSIATLGAMVIAVILFAIVVLLMKIFSKEEIETLPMGKKLSGMLVKLKVY